MGQSSVKQRVLVTFVSRHFLDILIIGRLLASQGNYRGGRSRTSCSSRK